MEVDKPYAGVYHKNKESQDRWRRANQEKINEYYRNKRAELRVIKLEERNKQIALEYISKELKK